MTSEKWIGVHTGGSHYLDHLGILCQGLDIPLIVTEQKTYQVAQQYYPQLKIEYHDLSELTLEYLAHRADVIFESGHHFALELIPLWELLHGKKMRVVYCPHGNSDKVQRSRKDISLVYGQHMYNHLQKTGELGRLEKTIFTGNYRLAYYKMNKRWYDDRLAILLKDQLRPDRQTVFYAPTWSDQEMFSSWLKYGRRVIEEVGSLFNLLLRWHPFLDDLYPAESEKIKEFCKYTPGVVDLSHFPSIYPILDQADFYLGDFSSVGYDFLSQDKPLFFLDRHGGEIYDCGITLTESSHWGKAIQEFQDEASWKTKRCDLSKRVFKEDCTFEIIRKDLEEALSQDRASWLEI